MNAVVLCSCLVSASSLILEGERRSRKRRHKRPTNNVGDLGPPLDRGRANLLRRRGTALPATETKVGPGPPPRRALQSLPAPSCLGQGWPPAAQAAPVPTPAETIERKGLRWQRPQTREAAHRTGQRVCVLRGATVGLRAQGPHVCARLPPEWGGRELQVLPRVARRRNGVLSWPCA